MLHGRTPLKTWIMRLVLAAGGLIAVMLALPLYAVVTATPVHSQPQSAPSVALAAPSPKWSATVDRARQMMRVGLAEQNLPGLSVAVGVGGDIVWAEGFGWSEIEDRVPVTPSTRFRIGTASTALTSAAVGALVEQERLKLDDDIQTHVPEFPKKQWPVTVRQLMGHVAGIGTDSAEERPLSRRRCEQPVDALRYFADDALQFEPGTQYRYSNYGWILVSAAIEAAADRPFLMFMQEQILQPLGMDGTGAESAADENPERVGEPAEDAPFLTLIQDVIMKPLGIGGAQAVSASEKTAAPATPYVSGFGPKPVFRHRLHVRRPGNLSCYAGAMAFLSTPSDLVRFGLAMTSSTLLQPSTVQALQSSQQLTSGRGTGQGLGWDIATVTLAGVPTRMVGLKGGPMSGGVVSLMTLPERGIVVAVMSNISHADTSALALKIAEAFAGRSAQN